MAMKGYKNIAIPETLWNQIQKIRTEQPEIFTWRSINEFCIDAIRRQKDKLNEKTTFGKKGD